MQFGNCEIHVVSDGMAASDGGATYGLVPRILWQEIAPPDELNRIPTALNCLLIVSEGKRILVDTGYGAKLDAKAEKQFGRTGGSQLIVELAALGVAPQDIDIVINTHLHADHCGGNTVCAAKSAGPVAATFPKAEYWIQRLEWADAAFPNERTRGTYFADNFQPVRDHTRLLDGDTRVTSEVRCMITRGHTRAHQSVLIESQGNKALFLGDIAGRGTYLERLAWIPAFDVEPLETLETKRRLRDWAVEENILLIFQHDPGTPFARMHRQGDRYRLDRITF